MTERMKAVVKLEAAPGAQMTSVKIPEIKPNEVLVKVKATSICGTDVHIYKWDEWARRRIRPPQILGHELAGEVVEVGKEVKSLKVGDYISAESHIPCGSCIQCKTGQQHICANLEILGVDRNGCFAEYVAIPEAVAWKNDPELPLEFASVQEPLGNSVYATLVTEVAGKTMAIFGDGPTGLFAIGVAKVSGAAKVFAVGRHPRRLEIAKEMGADVVLNEREADVVEEILSATEGIGVDIVQDMAGTQAAIEEGLEVLRKGGRFTAFGIPPEPVRIDLAKNVIFKGVTIYGINGREMFDTWFKVANLLGSGLLDISPVITHKLPLEDFERGFELMMKRPKVAAKIVLFP
jgi:threonine 3-dehydrogenase